MKHRLDHAGLAQETASRFSVSMKAFKPVASNRWSVQHQVRGKVSMNDVTGFLFRTNKQKKALTHFGSLSWTFFPLLLPIPHILTKRTVVDRPAHSMVRRRARQKVSFGFDLLASNCFEVRCMTRLHKGMNAG